MIGRTLSFYLAGRFARTVIAAFMVVFVLIYAVDLVELLRRSGDSKHATGILMAGLSFLRTPTVAEQALPFAVLFGSMIAFLNLSRKMELVVARAAGVSVWQFLTPPLVVMVLIGVFSVVAYNPASTWMKQKSDEIESKVFGGLALDSIGLWIRQKSVDGQAVIRAASRSAGGGEFNGIEVFNFDEKGNFVERLEAASGELRDGYWVLHNVVVVTPGFEASTAPTYLLATNLDRSEVAQAFVAPETVSFWRLPGLAEETARAGLDPTAYLLKYEELLARPLMLASMVLVAACFSLRFLPNGRDRIYGFRWRPGGVHALCGHQSGQRSRWSRLPQRLPGGVVARGRRLHVWRVRAAATRGWLMGFAVSFSFESNRRQTWAARIALSFAVAAAAAWTLLFTGPAAAQSPPLDAQSTQAKPQDKLVIDADELVYDKDKNTISAVGSVQLFYQGRVLQADRVTYDRATKRVYAEGHAKMTDEHGNIIYGSRFALSDDFRDGFIDSVQVLTTDKTRFSSPRVERSNGDVTVLQKGAYTACEPCKDHPERPPFWQVKATKIIENQETHTIYYEDAQLQFWGFPVFYMPYFSSAELDRQQEDGPFGARARFRGLPRHWHQLALFHQSGAQLRPHPDPNVSFKAGFIGRDRLAPATIQRHVQHSGDRDRPGAAWRLPRLSLWRGRSAPARRAREHRELFSQ